jgi:hypothetical protein
MSSTEDAAARLGRLFDGLILSGAKSMRLRGIMPLSTGPDPELRSYYVERGAGTSYIREFDPTRFAHELRAFWRDDPELAALADELADVARELGSSGSEDGEVSPLIYAMY